LYDHVKLLNVLCGSSTQTVWRTWRLIASPAKRSGAAVQVLTGIILSTHCYALIVVTTGYQPYGL
jgi:hypothetical protein